MGERISVYDNDKESVCISCATWLLWSYCSAGFQQVTMVVHPHAILSFLSKFENMGQRSDNQILLSSSNKQTLFLDCTQACCEIEMDNILTR